MNNAAGRSKKKITIGLDLGDRRHTYCVLDETGKVAREGTLGPWVSRFLQELGLRAIVTNPRKTQAICRRPCCAFEAHEIVFPPRRRALEVVSEIWTTRASILNRVMGWKELAISKPQQTTNRRQQQLAAQTRIALLQSHQSQKQTL